MENERVLIATDRRTLREVLEEVLRKDLDAKSEPTFQADRMTVSEASRFAGRSYRTFCIWINDGKIPVHGSGRTRFILKSELVRALKSME